MLCLTGSSYKILRIPGLINKIHFNETSFSSLFSASIKNSGALITAEDKRESPPLPANPYYTIDLQALQCPASEALNVRSLAHFLQKNASTDLEKARAIYIWITKNIDYDNYAYNTRIYGDYSPQGILNSRRALCGGFSNLFYALGKEMNLEIEKVIGYSKGYGYNQARQFKDADHAWNIIKIEGHWRVFDATWGEGSMKIINGQIINKKEFNDYWFNVSPYAAIFSHMPQDRRYMNVLPVIDLTAYGNLPRIDKEYFRLGFDPEDTYKHIYENSSLSFPHCYKTGTYVKALKAPKYSVLYTNRTYEFEFYIPKGISVAAVDAANKWTFFESKNGNFKLHFNTLVKGELQLCMKYETDDDSYYAIMIYELR